MHLDEFIAIAALSATDLTFGYEYIADSAKVRVNSVVSGFPFSQNASAHMETNAGYAGLQTTILDRLTLTGQIRQDSVLNNKPFTWRTGAVLDTSEIWTHFHAAYGTAFRAPSLFDRYGVDSFGYGAIRTSSRRARRAGKPGSPPRARVRPASGQPTSTCRYRT